MSKATKRIIVIVIIFFTVLLLTGIAVYFYKTLSETAKSESFSMSDVSTASNLKQMVEDADAIVVGKYEGLHSTVNLIRDENDPSKESKKAYLGGKVYRFQVDRTLKGDIEENEIRIVHRYSGKFDIEETFGYKNEEVEEADPTFIKPSIGKTYIAFIKNPEVKDFYGQSSEPFLIVVNDNNRVEIKSHIEDTLDFDDMVSGEKLIEVEEAIQSMTK